MQVIIPCAGESKRFFDAGYEKIKQLLVVNGKTVLEHVIDNFRQPDTQFYFLFQQKHWTQYEAELTEVLERAAIQYRVILIETLTDGAVNTALLAVPYLDMQDKLIIANSDQWVDWNLSTFLETMDAVEAAGGMPIFTDELQENKWSFVSVDDHMRIQEVRAKDAFTKLAVVGIYYFAHAAFFVYYGQEMLAANKRVNGEFYVCPVFNELILDQQRVFAYPVTTMVGLGTPADFEVASQLLPVIY